jgi:hypothetical protein
MKWLCHFVPHKWVHRANFVCGMNPDGAPQLRGLWQCGRCKELSEGRVVHWPGGVDPKDSSNQPALDIGRSGWGENGGGK